MGKHRAVIVGAGRIGAGWNWNGGDGHTHAGAYIALKDRVELVGFVELDKERGEAAFKKWGVPWCATYYDAPPHDIVSVCTNPENRIFMRDLPATVRGVWCEKPWAFPALDWPMPIQVNYQRRGSYVHNAIALMKGYNRRLVVYGKDDETTRCHFRDLARWWNIPMDYRPFNGPCAYILETESAPQWFDNGGVDSAECFKAMLGNLLDCIDYGTQLWSPPYVE